MPAAVVRCHNPECPHRGTDRQTDAYPAAGDGLYFQPTVVCACGHQPKVVDQVTAMNSPPARPVPSGRRKAVQPPPAKRTHG